MLRRHCDEAGTDFDRIERTCAYEFRVDDNGPLTKALLEQLEGLAEQGIDTVVGRVADLEQRAPLEHLVEPRDPGSGRIRQPPLSRSKRWRNGTLALQIATNWEFT